MLLFKALNYFITTTTESQEKSASFYLFIHIFFRSFKDSDYVPFLWQLKYYKHIDFKCQSQNDFFIKKVFFHYKSIKINPLKSSATINL